MRTKLLRIAVLLAAGLMGATVTARADWTTYHADGARSGVDRSSGRALPFAAAWNVPNLSGNVWAEPLVYRGLVIVATENNDLYAFRESNGARVWHVHVGAPVLASELPCGDIDPTVGITSTPVIDPGTGRLFAVADLATGTSASHTLVALDALTGKRLFLRNVDPPTSNPINQLQRVSLAWDRGRVLIGFGGNDGDCAQYRGYMVSAPANNAGPNHVYAVPTSWGGAIWSGGGAPAVDGAGNVFVPTGNAANNPPPFDHGDTLEKLSPLATQLDYWAPASWAQDSANDADLGSVAPVLLPGSLAYQGGKNGNGYLVSTSHMGHIGGELFSAPVCTSFGSDAFLNNIIYVACSEGIHALNLDAAGHRFSARWSGPSDANGPPIVAGGLVWVTSTADSKLFGLDPLTGAVKVNQSTPQMEHFITPAASDGRLFLATDTTLNSYTIAKALPCQTRVTIRLRVPRHKRIVHVTVYLGHHVIARVGGSRLRRISLAGLSTGSVTLRIVETPNRGHHLTLTVHLSDCRLIP